MNNKKPIRPQPQIKSNLKVVRLKPIINMLALTKKGGEIEFVNETDIVYCKANGGNTDIYFSDGRKLVIPRLLKNVLDSLSENNFHRIHNSYIVNIGYARKFIKKNHGGELELFDGSKLPVSSKNRNYILSLFKKI